MAVPLKTFVNRNHFKFPLVVQVKEGIYDDNELDSEISDFSCGDYLQLLRLLVEVNVTFESFYDQPSHQGQITLPLDYDQTLEVQSNYPAGHVFATAGQVLEDSSVTHVCPGLDFIVQDVKVQAGDRLRVMRKAVLPTGGEFLLCKRIKDDRNILVPLDTKGDFVKRGELATCRLSDIVERLPQRVRVVQDESMRIRGLDHGIRGLPAHYSGDLFLSKVDFVEACLWDAPEKRIKIPCSIGIDVEYAEGFESRFGNPCDIHEMMTRFMAVGTQGSTALSKFVIADMADDDKTVDKLNLQMNTIYALRGQELEKAVLASSRNKNLLIPTNFKGMFKVLSEEFKTFNTAYDLLESNYAEEVLVTSIYNTQSKGNPGDALYINDKVKIHCKEVINVPRVGDMDEYELVLLDRSFSTKGHVGLVKVPTYAQAYFQTAISCSLLQIIGLHRRLPVSLSYAGYPQSFDSTPSPDACLFEKDETVIIHGVHAYNVIYVSTVDDDDDGNNNRNSTTASPARAQAIPNYIPVQVRPLRPNLPGTKPPPAAATPAAVAAQGPEFIPPRKKVVRLSAEQFERVLDDVTAKTPIYVESMAETRPAKLNQSRPLPDTPDENDGYSLVRGPQSPSSSHQQPNSPQRALPAPPGESPPLLGRTPPTSPSSTSSDTLKRSRLSKLLRRVSHTK